MATLNLGGVILPAVTSGTTTLTLTGSNSGANTITGMLADNGAGRLSVVKNGTGLWIVAGANSYSGGTTVAEGTMRFDVMSGGPTIAAGATASVDVGATLELAGAVSALSSGPNRVNIINNSNAPGVLVSGTNQKVGNIDGSGTTQVNAGSDLTANHITQSALIIGGTATSHGLVTIDASDASGNPLFSNLAGSLAASDSFGASGSFGESLGVALDSETVSTEPGGSSHADDRAAVPEPSSLILVGIGVLALGGAVIRQRSGRRNRKNHDPRADGWRPRP